MQILSYLGNRPLASEGASKPARLLPQQYLVVATEPGNTGHAVILAIDRSRHPRKRPPTDQLEGFRREKWLRVDSPFSLLPNGLRRRNPSHPRAGQRHRPMAPVRASCHTPLASGPVPYRTRHGMRAIPAVLYVQYFPAAPRPRGRRRCRGGTKHLRVAQPVVGGGGRWARDAEGTGHAPRRLWSMLPTRRYGYLAVAAHGGAALCSGRGRMARIGRTCSAVPLGEQVVRHDTTGINKNCPKGSSRIGFA